MELFEHASTEFKILNSELAKINDKFILGPLENSMLKLIKDYENYIEKENLSSHVGNLMLEALTTIFKQEPLTPLKNDESEWFKIPEDKIEDEMLEYQNTRCRGVFKHKDGKIFYNYGIVWKEWIEDDDCYESFLGTIDGHSSYVELKSFPIIPISFDIYVKRRYLNDYEEVEFEDIMFYDEILDQNYIYTIIDPSGLNEIYEYYS